MGKGTLALGLAATGLATVAAADLMLPPPAAQTPTVIETDLYTARLPPAPSWECEFLPPDERQGMGPGRVCGRRLEGGRMVVAGIAEEFSDAVAGRHADEPVSQLLALIGRAQADERRLRGESVVAFSSTSTVYPVERAGAACSGYGEESVDRRAGTREVARGLICVDPQTRRPIRLMYLEEFPDGSQPRSTFEAEADQLFEGFRFRHSAGSPLITKDDDGEATASSTAAPLGAQEPTASATRPASGSFALYLHSMRRADWVPGEWRRLVDRHPELAALELRPTQPVSVPGDGTLYRILAGSFATRAEAQAICDRLRSQGQSCRPFKP